MDLKMLLNPPSAAAKAAAAATAAAGPSSSVSSTPSSFFPAPASSQSHLHVAPGAQPALAHQHYPSHVHAIAPHPHSYPHDHPYAHHYQQQYPQQYEQQHRQQPQATHKQVAYHQPSLSLSTAPPAPSSSSAMSSAHTSTQHPYYYQQQQQQQQQPHYHHPYQHPDAKWPQSSPSLSSSFYQQQQQQQPQQQHPSMPNSHPMVDPRIGRQRSPPEYAGQQQPQQLPLHHRRYPHYPDHAALPHHNHNFNNIDNNVDNNSHNYNYNYSIHNQRMHSPTAGNDPSRPLSSSSADSIGIAAGMSLLSPVSLSSSMSNSNCSLGSMGNAGYTADYHHKQPVSTAAGDVKRSPSFENVAARDYHHHPRPHHGSMTHPGVPAFKEDPDSLHNRHTIIKRETHTNVPEYHAPQPHFNPILHQDVPNTRKKPSAGPAFHHSFPFSPTSPSSPPSSAALSSSPASAYAMDVAAAAAMANMASSAASAASAKSKGKTSKQPKITKAVKPATKTVSKRKSTSSAASTSLSTSKESISSNGSCGSIDSNCARKLISSKGSHRSPLSSSPSSASSDEDDEKDSALLAHRHSEMNAKWNAKAAAASSSSSSPSSEDHLDHTATPSSLSGTESAAFADSAGGKKRKQVPEKERFQCSICGSTFGRGVEYRRHLNTVHNPARLYFCEHCQFKSNRIDNYRKHKTSHCKALKKLKYQL